MYFGNVDASAYVFTSLQADKHLMASHIASAQTKQRTSPPTVPPLLHVYLLQWSCDLVAIEMCLYGHYLANSCLCWLRSSGLEWTCHNILYKQNIQIAEKLKKTEQYKVKQ